jgi:hypothetical protein
MWSFGVRFLHYIVMKNGPNLHSSPCLPDLLRAANSTFCCSAVCFKSGQLDPARLQLLESGQAGSPLSPSAAQSLPRHGSGDSHTAFAASTVGSGVTAPLERKLSKRSSFSWSVSQKASASAARGGGNSPIDEGAGEGRNEEPAEREPVLNDRSAFSFTRKPLQGVRSSIVGASGSTHNLHEVTAAGGSVAGSHADRTRANSALTTDTSEMINADRPSSRTGSPVPPGRAQEDMLSEGDLSLSQPHTPPAGTVTDKLQQEATSVHLMNEVLNDPTRILSLDRGALNLLVRTFFCKVSDIEAFCNR